MSRTEMIHQAIEVIDRPLVRLETKRSHEPKSEPIDLSASLYSAVRVVWAFVESDYITFAVPNTLFGIVGALCAGGLVDGPQPMLLEVLKRLPGVLFFNSYNLLIFDLANQRTPESVEEDRINKPWRPIPSGKVTADQTRRAVLFASALALAFNYTLGVWKEGLLVQTLSWYYNDLRGGDEIFRDAIIAVSYGLANQTSLQLAIGPRNTVSAQGKLWTAIVSGVILTTMNVQDLKDQEGDRSRNRKTMPLVFGDEAARYALAIFVPLWSCICASFWGLQGVQYSLPLALGAVVVWRVLTKRTPKEDSRTWKLWCFWHASLYFIPLLKAI